VKIGGARKKESGVTVLRAQNKRKKGGKIPGGARSQVEHRWKGWKGKRNPDRGKSPGLRDTEAASHKTVRGEEQEIGILNTIFIHDSCGWEDKQGKK